MQIFKNFTEEHAPGPPKTVTVLIWLQTNSAGNLRSKMSNFGALPLKKLWLRSWRENINFK